MFFFTQQIFYLIDSLLPLHMSSFSPQHGISLKAIWNGNIYLLLRVRSAIYVLPIDVEYLINGIAQCITMGAENFLQPKTLMIIAMGVVAFGLRMMGT